MTRAEALQKVRKNWYADDYDMGVRLVNMLEILGVLKFDPDTLPAAKLRGDDDQ
jgi:hypothetical protein